MTNRGVATVLNAILWGSGYMYSGRGVNGVLALLANLALYFWSFELGYGGLILWGPILLLGALYFAIDGYRYALPVKQAAKTKDKSSKQKNTCAECGAVVSPNAKFCSECGADQKKTSES